MGVTTSHTPNNKMDTSTLVIIGVDKAHDNLVRQKDNGGIRDNTEQMRW